LPNSTKMELATLRRIAGLVDKGAVVYGPRPLEMLSMSDIKKSEAEFKDLVNQVWGDSSENRYGKGTMISGKPMGEVLSRLKILPDLTTDRGDPKEVMYIHRKIEDSDVYFVFNQQNKRLHREILFRVSGKSPELWDPARGTISEPAIYSQEPTQTRIPVSLKPYESKIFVFKKQTADPFIHKVSLAGRQVFPKPQAGSEADAIPRVTCRDGKFECTGDHAGDYSFETSAGRLIPMKLAAPKSIDLLDVKTTIEFASIADEVIPSIEVTGLRSLTDFDDPAIKYFAGKARYSMEFSVPKDFTSTSKSITLNLGDLSATAEVRLNGTALGFAWIPNSELEVSHLLKKENKLEVTVANVCRNRFIGDLRQGGEIKSLWTTSPIETILNKDMPLKPSGLIGPVKLSAYQTYSE
jgi:hypothetical protein